MGRPHRIQLAGGTYHVTARGVRREAIFLDGIDRRFALALVSTAVRRHGWRVYSYCLLSNHFHLAFETPSETLSQGMHRLMSVYARWFNDRHGKDGHAFGARFFSELVLSEQHLADVLRYLALNPVRAGVCGAPEDWPWSSYAATVGEALAPWFLDSSWLVRDFGVTVPIARAAFRLFVDEGLAADAAVSA